MVHRHTAKGQHSLRQIISAAKAVVYDDSFRSLE